MSRRRTGRVRSPRGQARALRRSLHPRRAHGPGAGRDRQRAPDRQAAADGLFDRPTSAGSTSACATSSSWKGWTISAGSIRSAKCSCAETIDRSSIYMLTTLFSPHAPWLRRMYFPVRANFFYESWAGIVINALIGGMAMYPAIWRDGARRELNKVAMQKVAEVWSSPVRSSGCTPKARAARVPIRIKCCRRSREWGRSSWPRGRSSSRSS